MAKAGRSEGVVLVDVYRWYDGDDSTPWEPTGQLKEAAKGEKVSVPNDYFEHALENEQLAKPRSKDAKAASDEAAEEADAEA